MDNTLISPLTQPYLDAIRAEYPDLEVHSSLPARNGQYNDILILNDQWAFRFPRYPHGVEEMLAEFSLLDKIAPYLTLSIPRPVYHSSSLQVGQAFTGYHFIPGISLYRNVLQNLAREVQLNLAGQLANFLVELHGLPVQDFCPDAPVNDQPGNWAEMYFKVRTLLMPHMRPDAQKWCKRHFESFLEDQSLHQWSPCLRHGDLGPSNIIFDPQLRAISGIIDFSSIAPGDPAVDLAALSCLGEPFFSLILDACPQNETTLRRVQFYRGAFALEEALAGLRDHDEDAYRSGMESFI